MIITLKALNLQEAETMVSVIDKWYRHFYVVHGVKRLYSASERLTGIATIMVEISPEAWNYTHDGIQWEILHRLDKSLVYHNKTLATVEVGSIEVI